jgi:hypothetical protein
MSRPTVAPDWATNTNHPAGANPWNGQPNKVQPSAGKIAGGFVPGTGMPAEELNERLNNHALWLNYRGLEQLDDLIEQRGLFVRDHFVGQSLSTAHFLTPTGTTSIIDDSANGGSGTLKIDGSGGGTNQVDTQNVSAGTGDFRLRARLRVTGVGGASSIGFGFRSGGINAAFIIDGPTSTTNWRVLVDGVNTAPNGTAAAVNAAYKEFIIERKGGTLSFTVDGVVLHSVAHAGNIAGNPMRMQSNSAGILFVDYVRGSIGSLT